MKQLLPLLLLLSLAACASLPVEAKEAVLNLFNRQEERPQIESAHQGELLPADVTAGVTEVWCVNVAHLCYNCAMQQLETCISPYLVRRMGNEWVVSAVVGEDNREEWTARGCPESGGIRQ